MPSNTAIAFENKDKGTNPECAFYNLLVSHGLMTPLHDTYKSNHTFTTLYVIGKPTYNILIPCAQYNIELPGDGFEDNQITMDEFIRLCNFDAMVTNRLLNLWVIIKRYLGQRKYRNTTFHELYINSWINELIEMQDAYKFKIMFESIKNILYGGESMYVKDFINNPRFFLMAECGSIPYVDVKYSDLVPLIVTDAEPKECYKNIYKSLDGLIAVNVFKQILDYLLVNYEKLLDDKVTINTLLSDMDDIVLSTNARYSELESIIDHVQVGSYWYNDNFYRVAISKKSVTGVVMDRLILSDLLPKSGHEVLMVQSGIDNTYYAVKCVSGVPNGLLGLLGSVVSFEDRKYVVIVTDGKFKTPTKNIDFEINDFEDVTFDHDD
jgi:hypothetical protein